MTRNTISGAKLIYDKLVRKNVKDVFLYSGGSIMPLVDTFYKSKDIKYYINTHEQNCGHSATAYAKSTGKPGIVITTSGPGLTNCITPMLDAQNDSTPLIVFSGQVNKEFLGTGAFQEAPSVNLTKTFTKKSYMVESISEIPYIIDEAFHIANEGKKGVVHIDLPKCIQVDTVTDKAYIDYLNCNNEDNHITFCNSILSSQIGTNKYYKSQDIINKIYKAISTAKKPIFFLGQGCLDAEKEINELVNEVNIPFTTTIHAKGIIDEKHPMSLKWCGMHGYPAANYALQEADCIIGIGARFDDRTTGNIKKYAPNAVSTKKIINVNIEPKEFNKTIKSHLNLGVDARSFLNYMLDQNWGDTKYKTKHMKKWHKYINDLKIRYPTFKINHVYPSKINTQYVISTLDKILGSDKFKNNTLISTGVGNHQMMTYQFINGNHSRKIFSSGSLGVMGAGLPYAIGLQIANPNKLVIDIDGDSSFLMTMSDMKTIMEYNLPIKIIVMNDGKQMMVNIWEKLFFEGRHTATINNNNPSFKDVAEAFGIKGYYTEGDYLVNTLYSFINYEGPALLECKVEPDICLPLVGPGKALDEMIEFDDYYDKYGNIIYDPNNKKLDKSAIPG